MGKARDRGEFVSITGMAPAAAIAAFFFGAMALGAEPGATLSFLRSAPITLGYSCCSVLASDFNNDGKTDIAASHGEAGVTVFLNDGKGSFTRRDWPLALGAGFTVKGLVASADLNGDGIADIVAITQVSAGGQGSAVLLGRGDGAFRTPISLGADVVKAVADFNGDGKLDLLVHPCSTDIDCGFAVRFGNGDGTFQPAGPVTLPPAGDFTWAVVADFNGDGEPDVVETTFRPSNSGSVYLWLGNGDGTFRNLTVTALGSAISPVMSSQLVTGDFNRDGRPDLAVLVSRNIGAANLPGIEILLGDGKGSFTAGQTYPTSAANPLITADFDHDGRLDLAAGFTLLLGNGDGSFQAAQSFGQYSAPEAIAPPGGMNWVVAGDFNGDGKADIAGPAGDGTQLSILVNNTPGRDASANAVSAADYSTVVAPGSIATLFGSDLATSTAWATGLLLPTSLGNTSVRILDGNGVERLGGLLYVSPTQINFVIPSQTATGFAIFNVTGSLPSVDGARSTMIAPLAPAFFTLDGTRHGPPAATAIRVHTDGSQTSLPVAQCSAAGVCSSIPIDLGAEGAVYLSLYGTGFRQATAANCDTSTYAYPAPNATYVGPQPTVAGLDQMNLHLPGTLPSGAVTIRCQFITAVSGYLVTGDSSFTIVVR